MMPRPQFSIRTLLWLTLVVAAFLGGIGFEKATARRQSDDMPMQFPKGWQVAPVN